MSADDKLLAAYEDVSYVGTPNPYSHPNRLAVIATLFGMQPRDPGNCRVLEFACGDGGNLFPMAAALPRSEFVGFDFAPGGIAQARRSAEAAGLANVRFEVLDLRSLPTDLGTYDYVIAHGLYSWIPDDVRALILPLIKRHLAPHGIGFVSYNAYPGCHIREIVWDIVGYHTRSVPDMRAKMTAARSLLALLAEPATTQEEGDDALRAEFARSARHSDSALAHDDLSKPNQPVYFHQFVADAQRSGLEFLCEAELHSMTGAGLSLRARQALGSMQRLDREQYLDFVHLRRFRQSLLCHPGMVERFAVQPARAAAMHVRASRALIRIAREGRLPIPGDETKPRARALRDRLIRQWPGCEPVSSLAQWYESLPVAAGDASPSIELLIVQTFAEDLSDLHVHAPQVAATAAERPCAFAPARVQARRADWVTNVYHEQIELADSGTKALLPLLDGTRTRFDLIAALQPVLGGAGGERTLEAALSTFAKAALLVA